MNFLLKRGHELIPIFWPTHRRPHMESSRSHSSNSGSYRRVAFSSRYSCSSSHGSRQHSGSSSRCRRSSTAATAVAAAPYPGRGAKLSGASILVVWWSREHLRVCSASCLQGGTVSVFHYLCFGARHVCHFVGKAEWPPYVYECGECLQILNP